MAVFSLSDFADHEQVVFVSDDKSGLKAIIAVHNSKLGPALGGCRMWPYASEEEAVRDVLRLSRGMTYKSAMANLKLGGGKSVIIDTLKKPYWQSHYVVAKRVLPKEQTNLRVAQR